MANSQFEKIEKDLEELITGFKDANKLFKDLEHIQSEFESLAKTHNELKKIVVEVEQLRNEYLEKNEKLDEYLEKNEKLDEYLGTVKQFNKELYDIPYLLNQKLQNFEERFTQLTEENETKFEELKSQIIENVSIKDVDLGTKEPDNTQSVKKLPTPPPSAQEMEDFLSQLDGVILDSKADQQVAHSFLRKNLDKLNDRFPEVLQNWSNKTLPKVEAAEKQEFIKRVTAISSLIRKFDGGVRATNLEIALTGHKIVASILTPTETPRNWVVIQNCLGLTYLKRVQGERDENLRKAIAYFNAALDFCTQEQFPKERKTLLENIKKAKTQLINI
ncbi:MAG: hypothetical protein F6K54_09640 [Okeania sp. SIO3B5]|uniref:hypothetical protein n=1 Tax=Okeania sp. SIO3B5 TaxID=2607811 RepID=UPI0013FEA9B8|nr:hypothetical protein [Okeania sp. SIO3B5]NEO53318.1 hypothetical protein [Okeania sp. SIO3B5]